MAVDRDPKWYWDDYHDEGSNPYHHELRRLQAEISRLTAELHERQRTMNWHQPVYVTDRELRPEDFIDQPQPRKTHNMAMHDSAKVFLASDTIRALRGIFEADTDQKLATRELLKTFNKTIKVGDLVTVATSTRHGVSTLKIVEADVDIDIESSEPIRWIISTIDLTEYNKFKVMEDEMISTMRQAELKSKREDMREKVMGRHADILQGTELARIGVVEKPVDADAATEPAAK